MEKLRIIGNELTKKKKEKNNGRPPKKEIDKLKHKIVVSFTDKEYEKLSELAGLTPLHIFIKNNNMKFLNLKK